MEKLTKEQKILIKKGYTFIDLSPKERTKIEDLFVYVNDTRKLHESGFPFIRIFGNIGKNQLIDLGWHDHYLIYCLTNTDVYGKNLFHIMRWNEVKFYIKGNNFWCSTFEIKEDGELR